MFYRYLTYTLILFLSTTPVLASEGSLSSRESLKPRVEANWRASNDRSILMTEFWVPVAQNEIDGSVVYGDLRLMGDSTSNREFNLGAGYRKMVETALLKEGIVGVNIWYDRRFTKRGSKFNQITAGIEWFGDVWDAKLNAYMPLNGSKNHTQSNPNGSNAHFTNNQIIVNTDQSVVEEALPGIDFELGWKVPFMDDFTDSTRVYAGAYHFQGDKADNVTGWRARIVSDVTSDVQLGARFQRDDERGSQAFVEATIRFPFGNKQSYKKKGLRARLDESPERDIDIVSNEAVTDQGIGETLLNAVTGDIQNVIHVDNTAAGGGDGSAETPFNTLAAANGVAGTNDLIYVHRGDGTTAGQNAGITLDDEGQMLIGSGSNLTYSSGRFSTSNGLSTASNVIIPADPLGAPVITNGAGSGVEVRTDGTFLSGFTVDGAAAHGIYGLNISGTAWTKGMTVENTISQNNGTSGFIATTVGAGSSIENISMTNNITENNGFTGFQVTGALGQVNITNNTSQNNFATGFHVIALGGNTITNATLTNNISDNNSIGFAIDADVGVIERATLTGNTAKNNGSYGFYARTRNASSLQNVSFTNNTAQNNTVDGFRAEANGAGSTLNTTTFTNNTAAANGAHGFYTYALNGGTIGQADLAGNTSQNNTQSGFYTFSGGGVSTIANIDFTNNIADTNSNYGFYTLAQNNNTIGQANFTGNTSQDNMFEGFRMEATGAGSALDITLTNNIADNNGSHGFYAYAPTNGSIGQADFIGNISQNNTQSGFSVYTINNGTIGSSIFESNITKSNSAIGFAINDDSVAGSIAIDMGGGALGSNGNNQAFNNTNVELLVDLDGGELKAENNWWGSVTGLSVGELLLQDGSTADTTPFLSADPNL